MGISRTGIVIGCHRELVVVRMLHASNTSHLAFALALFSLRLAATLDGEKSISAQIYITPNATQKKMSHSLFQMVFGSEKGLIHERRRQAT